jgi:hypothetical protein
MKLSRSNRFLRSKGAASEALYISAKTSSAVDGIRQPFSRDAKTGRFKDVASFTEYWKARTRKRAADN